MDGWTDDEGGSEGNNERTNYLMTMDYEDERTKERKDNTQGYKYLYR